MDLDLLDCLGRVKLVAKFHWTDLVICSHSREWKTLVYSRINMLDLDDAVFHLISTVCILLALYVNPIALRESKTVMEF